MSKQVYVEPRVARVFTTPGELRQLADRMDALWDDTLPGGDLTAGVWFGEEIQIELVVDQGHMPRPSGEKALAELRQRKKIPAPLKESKDT